MPSRGVAAVVDGPHGPIRVEEVTLDPPGPGEVVVRLVASGVCHSDQWAIHHGNWGAPFPMTLGHEGAGVVDEVGEGVIGHRVGDHVLLAWAVPCGTCSACRRGVPRVCAHAWSQPPRVRVARTGGPLQGTLSLGTLASFTVVHAAQLIPVPPDADLSRVCLLGCGASTGVGAVVNTGQLRAGSTVAVIGLGGIGLASVQGARIAGASQIIAIDLVRDKLEIARRLGATDVVDASVDDSVGAVRALTGGEGVDASFEATGSADVVAQAVAMLRRGGVAVAIGVPLPDSAVTLPWGAHAYPNKVQIRITDGGDPLPEDFGTWIDWYRQGELDLDAMVTKEVALTAPDLDEVFRAMLAGEVVRSVVQISE